MKNIMKIMQYLPTIMALISSIEALKKSRQGAEKKQWVVSTFRMLFDVLDGLNVLSAEDEQFVSDLVDILVKRFNASGGVPVADPPPTGDSATNPAPLTEPTPEKPESEKE